MTRSDKAMAVYLRLKREEEARTSDRLLRASELLPKRDVAKPSADEAGGAKHAQ